MHKEEEHQVSVEALREPMAKSTTDMFLTDNNPFLKNEVTKLLESNSFTFQKLPSSEAEKVQQSSHFKAK